LSLRAYWYIEFHEAIGQIGNRPQVNSPSAFFGSFLLPSAVSQPAEDSNHNIPKPASVPWFIKMSIDRKKAILCNFKVSLAHQSNYIKGQ
jgi:hypothetical protein